MYFQGFVFCALLEFALVNYASRSDMQVNWENKTSDNKHCEAK